ncbi:MAG: HAD-IA family hydrolase [Gemmatimonadota bacterium]
MLFDMDGTLVDSRASVERTWRRWAAPRGLDADALLRVAHGRRTRETLATVVAPAQLDAAVAELDAAELIDLAGTVEVAGARALVATLPDRAWAIVTSAGKELARLRLRAAGIPVPRLLVSSEDVLRGKPDPEGYLLAASRLGAAPDRCLVFEDTPAGIGAGLAAGARVLGLTTTHERARLTGAIAILDDYRGVRLTQETQEWRVDLP